MSEAQVNHVLEWIGFSNNDNRRSIMNSAFSSLRELSSFKAKDISALEEDYSRRTSTGGKINFGIRIIKRMKTLVQAGERAEVSKKMEDDSDTNSIEATPGPLNSEQVWTEWQPKFINYISTILGVNGVPLSYVIRDNELPDRDGLFTNFNE